MAGIRIDNFRHGIFSSDLDAVVRLYNSALRRSYGFFPLEKDFFLERVVKSRPFRPDFFLLARSEKKLVGMLHAGIVSESGYGEGGVVELVAVDPEWRRRGIGGLLLDEAMRKLKAEGVGLVDGGGTFPFTPFYSTLLDGSERSGPLLSDAGAVRLFESRGFVRERESFIMRAFLNEKFPPQPEAGSASEDAEHKIHRRNPGRTWLDYVFRGWDLYDSMLCEKQGGRVMTKAIYGRMSGCSNAEGREVFAVFGVNTAPAFRGNGWAKHHFRVLRKYLKEQGAEILELHVYADNIPAVRLYRASGFHEMEKTVTLRYRF